MSEHISRWAIIGLCLCTCVVVLSSLLGTLAGEVSAAAPDDVLFTKTAVVSGTHITYTLTITNEDSVAHLVTIDDQMPDGVEIGESCTVSDPDILEDVVFSRADDRLTASAVLTPAQMVSIACPAEANVGIEVDKSAVQPIISSGDAVSFTVTLTNSGAITLTHILLEDPKAACDLPPDLLSPADVTQLTCITTNVQATFTNILTASAEASIINQATAVISTADGITQTAQAETTIVVSDTVVGMDDVTVIPQDDLSLVVSKTAVQDGTTLTYTMTVTNTSAQTVTLYIADRMNGIQAEYCLAPNGESIQTGAPLNGFTRTGRDVLAPNEVAQFICVATVNPQINIKKSPMMQTVTAGEMTTFTIMLTGSSNPTSAVRLQDVTVTDSLDPDCTVGANDGMVFTVSGVCSVLITDTTTTTITATAAITFSNQFTATIIDPQTLEPISETTAADSITHTFQISDTDIATVIVEPLPTPSVSLTKTVSLINDDTQLLWAINIKNEQNVPTTVNIVDQFEGITADYCLDPDGNPIPTTSPSWFVAGADIPPAGTVQFVCVSTIDPTVEITLTPSSQEINAGETVTLTLSHVADGVLFSSVTITTPNLDCVNGACSVPNVTADFTQSATIIATLNVTNNVQASVIHNEVTVPNTTVTAVATYTAVFSDEDSVRVNVIDPLPILDVDKTAVQDGTTLTWTVLITNNGRVPATLHINDRMRGIQADYCLDPNGNPLLDQDGNERGALTFFVRTGEDVLQPNESITFTCVATVNPTLTVEKSPPIQTVIMGDTATFDVVITATVAPTSQLQFENVTISDPIIPACQQATITPTVSGFSNTYSCEQIQVMSDITNIITVAADIIFSNEIEVSAIDPDTSTALASTTVTDMITAHITVSDTAVALVDARSTAEEGISLSKQSVRDGNEVTYTISIANSNLAASPPLTVTDRFPDAFLIQSCDYVVMDGDGDAKEITDQIDNHVLMYAVELPAGTEAEIVCIGTVTADLVTINTSRRDEVRQGNDALFDVTIFNTSNIELTDLTITSNITCTMPATDELPANSETFVICTYLDTNAPVTATVTASATATYLNIATVQSNIEEPFFIIADVDELTTTLAMSDTASVTVLSEPGLVLTKTAAYQSIPDAPDIITYTISVTNSGTLSATYVITDDFPSLSSETGQRLDARCNGGALTDKMTQTLVLEPNEGATFVCVGELDPAVVVTKTAVSTLVESGTDGEFTTDIHNTGNVDLIISLTDDLNACPANDQGLSSSTVLPCNNIATVPITQTVSNTAVITGITVLENKLSASIVGVPDSETTVRVFTSIVVTNTSTAVIQPYADQQLNIEKTTNGFDGDDPNNLPNELIIPVGELIQWDYVISNRGNFTFTDLILSDNDPNIGQINESHCNSTLSVLYVGQTITCTVTGVAVEGQYVNIALVVATLEDTEIALSDTDRSAYLGVTPTTTLGTIGNVVFHDINNDGRKSGTEPGLAGVSVILTLPDDSTRITTTDENGRYQFTNLLEGVYRLDIDTASLPDNKLGAINSFDPDQSDSQPTGNNTASFTISPTITTTVQNFGYHLLNTVGEISGNVFHDVLGLDGDGLAGVRVNLLLPDGSDRPSVTDENGRYQFTNLPLNNTYEIVVITATLPISKQNATNSSDPDLTTDGRTTVTLTDEIAAVNNLHFGYLLSTIVGGIIVNDLDGIPASGDEQGIPDVLVRLLNDENEVVDEQITVQSGSYAFRDRPVGIYYVEVVTSTLPDSKNGFASTYPDPNPITLEANTLVNNQNLFGFRPLLGTVNGIVYHDTNQNNRIDSGETFPPDVSVILTTGNEVIAVTRTGRNGQYELNGIIPGEYMIALVDETLPADKQCLAEQGNRINITTDDLTETVQFGVVSCPNGLIGNRVWSDDDGDLMYDPNNDTPLAGIHITLTLLLPIGTPSGAVLTTTTDADGLYQFNNLPLGGYEVVVDVSSLPEERTGWVITVDPDGLSLDGRSILFLNSDEPSNLAQDFAFGQIPTAVRLTGQTTLNPSMWTTILLLVGVTVYLLNMSSFSNPHYMYLFEMTNGKQKLAYGSSPEDALDILRMRLSDEEMALIIPDQHKKVSQRRMQEYIGNLG